MSPSRAVLGVLVVVAAACGPHGRTPPDQADAGPTPCAEGSHRCTGSTLETCTGGDWSTSAVCPDACSDELGCVACLPGTGTCNGTTSTECLPDGSGYHDVFCDPVQGMACGASGACEGACSPNALGDTYYGCDYWPTVTGNTVDMYYDYAVAVANTAQTTATITVDTGALPTPEVFTVPPGSVVVQPLPWVEDLKGGGPTITPKGAYHLRSDTPVTVYQFNPLQYYKAGATANSYTNDASLLYPTNVWREDHYVAAWHQTGNVFPSELTVTAAHDATTVTITTSTDTPAAGNAPGFTAGIPQSLTVNTGDVIELATIAGDLNGTHVTSDQPVEVIGGHYCAYVPDDTWGYCDHLEEVMPPVDTLASDYIVTAPAVIGIPNGKEECVRIIATEPNTTLTYDPPQPTAPTSISYAGGWIELSRTAASFRVTANHKILVAQFMEGSTVAGNTGDPSMTVAVPIDQFRSDYLFHAPTNYQTNYVDIVAPVAAVITLDGAPIPPIVAIGTSGWGLARINPLSNGPAGDGNHRILGNVGFGIQVYGYGMDTSYWYPGGLDLHPIVIE